MSKSKYTNQSDSKTRTHKSKISQTKSKSRNTRGKEFELNVSDSDVNMEDLDNVRRKRRSRTSKSRDGRGNDPSWYSHYPQLLDNVTGVNFGIPLGSPIDYKRGQVGKPTKYSAAGICSITFMPCIGSCFQNEPINNANKVAMQLYSAMRWKLGSTASYEANDIMMYLGAMDSAYLLYALGVKIYGSLRLRSPFNYYFGENLLSTMGVNYNSFAENAEDFRAQLNQYAIFLSSLYVPAEFDIFKRHVWMLTNIFTDSETAKAQMYQYNLHGYYHYNENPEAGGPAYLEYHKIKSNLSLSDWRDMINLIMKSVLGSSDFNQMSADIGKAFEGDTFSVSIIPEDYLTPISYSKEVLSQIENCVLMGDLATTTEAAGTIPNGSIQQQIAQRSVSRIYQNAYFVPLPSISSHTLAIQTMLAGWLNGVKLLNFHTSEISNDDVMVATRGICGDFTGGGVVANFTDNVVMPKSYGTEIYMYATLYIITHNTDTNITSLVGRTYRTMNLASDNGMAYTGAIWSQFDWAPMYFIMNSLESTTNTSWDIPVGDLDMYGLVDRYQIKALNECAVLSEFYSSKFPQVSGK